MSVVAQKVKDQRDKLWAEAQAVVAAASEENRNLSAEEQGKYESIMQAMDDYDARMRGILNEEKRQKATDDAFNAAVSRKPEQRTGAATLNSDGRNVNDEIRDMLRGTPGAPKSIEVRHSGVFGNTEFRTLLSNSGSPTSVVPTDFYDQLVAHLIEVSGVLQTGPSVLNTAGGESLQIPKTTSHSTAALTGQGSSLPTGDPAFSMVTLSAYKYGIMLQVARELVDDTAVDLQGYLAMQAGRAVGNAFGSDLINGNGSSKPTGLVAATSASPAVTGALSSATSGFGGVVGSPSYGNLVDMEYSVIAPYRQSKSCYWIAADKTIGGFRKITDGQGRPIWEPSTVLGSPDLLLGKPLVADTFMPAQGANAFSIAFGDFAQFFIRLVGGVRFERSDDFAFGSDLITYRCLLRGDGTLVDTNAVKIYKGGAS